MGDNNAQIIQRFDEFGKQLCGEVHGWKKKYADALSVAPAQLSSMRSGLVPIGPKMQNKLRQLGADVDYILTGRKSGALADGVSRNIATDDDLEMIRILKSSGVDNPHKARALLQRDQQYRAIATGEPYVLQPALNTNAVYSHDYSQLKTEKKKEPHK